MNRFGQYLMRLRKKSGLSVRQAAREARISDSYLSLLERGKRKNVPGGRILAALARLYGVETQEMLIEAGAFFDDDDPSEDEVIDQAFQQVIAHPEYRKAARLSEELSTDAKKFIIELYEERTGETLLKRTGRDHEHEG